MLRELSASISVHGVVQPLVVSRGGDGRYTLIAGERRLRAARMAGLQEVPAVVRDLGERELMEVSLIEEPAALAGGSVAGGGGGGSHEEDHG